MKKLVNYKFDKAIVAHGHPIHTSAQPLLVSATSHD
jgi:hypothetical protein